MTCPAEEFSEYVRPGTQLPGHPGSSSSRSPGVGVGPHGPSQGPWPESRGAQSPRQSPASPPTPASRASRDTRARPAVANSRSVSISVFKGLHLRAPLPPQLLFSGLALPPAFYCQGLTLFPSRGWGAPLVPLKCVSVGLFCVALWFPVALHQEKEK